MQVIDEILKAINKSNANVSQIARDTGIPGSRIYKWLEGKGRPKVEDANIMIKWAAENSELIQIFGQEIPKIGKKEEPSGQPSPMQILSVLADAFRDQAKAFADQASIIRSIEKGMAREETQEEIRSSLRDVRQVVDKISEGQNKAVPRFLKEFEALRKDKEPIKAVGKKKAGNGRGE